MVTGGLRRFLVTFIKNVTFVFWRWTDRRWKTRYCIAVYFVLQYTVQYIIPIQQYYCTILFYCTPIKDTTATTATPRPYCSSLQYSSYLLQSYQLEPLISSNQQYGNHHSIKRNYLFTPTQISKEFDASKVSSSTIPAIWCFVEISNCIAYNSIYFFPKTWNYTKFLSITFESMLEMISAIQKTSTIECRDLH